MPSFADLIRRVSRGLDVPQHIAAGLMQRVQPTLQVGSVSEWWENEQRTERPAFGRVAVVGTAGNSSWATIANPDGNHSDVYVEKAFIVSEGDTELNLEAVAEHVAGAQSADSMWRDFRNLDFGAFPIADVPVADLRGGSGAQPAGQLCGQVRATAPGTLHTVVKLDSMLAPGQALMLIQLVVDLDLWITFFWREIRQDR